MVCDNCGTKAKKGDKFCLKCGKPLKSNTNEPGKTGRARKKKSVGNQTETIYQKRGASKMKQVQCPNCGGYRVSEETAYYSDSAGKHLANDPTAPTGCSLLVVAVGVAMFMVVQDTTIKIVGILLVLLASGALVGMLGLTRMIGSANKGLHRVNKYACLLCGYRWEWHQGDPLPSVTVRPDLIQKGEQRLQAEEEERRKREEALQALHYLNQQRK